jgi:hypothetical protein
LEETDKTSNHGGLWRIFVTSLRGALRDSEEKGQKEQHIICPICGKTMKKCGKLKIPDSCLNNEERTTIYCCNKCGYKLLT